MAVNTTTNKIEYAGNGVTTVFAYNFRVLDATHLKVYVNGFLQSSGYTVSGVGVATGGNVTFAVAPGSGAEVLLVRTLPLTQPVATTDNATVLSSVLDTALDRVTMQVQQVQEEVDRSVQIPLGSDPSILATVEANLLQLVGAPYVYLGPFAAAPAARPTLGGGGALQPGDIYFDTTTKSLRAWDGANWFGAAAVSAISTFRFTATGGQTVFTGADLDGKTLYLEATAAVFLNGVRLTPAQDYTLSGGGATLTLAVAAVAGDELTAMSFTQMLFSQLSSDVQANATAAANSAGSAAASAAAALASQNSAASSSAAAGAASGRLVVATFAELATVFGYTTAGGRRQVAAGDVIWVLSINSLYTVAAQGASDAHLNYTGSGGVRLYVQRTAGRYNVQAWGAVGDGVTDDRVALQAAIDTGLPLFLPGPATYRITQRLRILSAGTDIIGPRSAVLQQATADISHFWANDIGQSSYVAIRGITIRGTTLSTGVTPAVENRGAIVLDGVGTFDIEDCAFVQHAGSAISLGRAGLYINGGNVRNCYFEKGVQGAAANPWGTQDSAPVQIFQGCQNINVEGNFATGKWYSGLVVMDQVSAGSSRIRGLRVVNNRWVNLSQYGFCLYTIPSLVAASIVDNGSGVFRVTTTVAHGLTTGDRLHISQAGTANGVWDITVVSPTAFDLIGSTFAAGALLTADIRFAENCSGIFENNVIDGVDGDRTDVGGGKPYGAGIYMQSVGGIRMANNVVRRANLFTDSQTLTPGAIGLNVATGPISVLGGALIDAGYHAISIANETSFARSVIIGQGMQIVRPRLNVVQAYAPNHITLRDIDVVLRPDSTGGQISLSDTAPVAEGFVLENITCNNYNATAPTRFIDLISLSAFTVRGVRVLNSKPASQVFEAVRIRNSTRGIIQGCEIDGNASAYTALTLSGVTNTLVSGNRIRMTADGNARPTVSMTGTCTGTVFQADNDDNGGRMNNASTGGAMHTTANNNNSGGQTRQAGDTIRSTLGTGPALWRKSAASAGATNWQTVTPV